jgi:hypothetical protein
MARLKPSGAWFGTLYEYVTSLDHVVSDLGLPPLTDDQERVVRDKLGLAIGQWLQESGYRHPDAKLDRREIAGTLRLIAVHSKP